MPPLSPRGGWLASPAGGTTCARMNQGAATMKLLATILLATMIAAGTARAQEKIYFGTDWLAEAEYGGYYQAVAKGFYRRHGLDVTIR
jgi:ABC-type nitrate/sulfonate/bicarbonate transport system substrate-binding protein